MTFRTRRPQRADVAGDQPEEEDRMDIRQSTNDTSYSIYTQEPSGPGRIWVSAGNRDKRAYVSISSGGSGWSGGHVWLYETEADLRGFAEVLIAAAEQLKRQREASEANAGPTPAEKDRLDSADVALAPPMKEEGDA